MGGQANLIATSGDSASHERKALRIVLQMVFLLTDHARKRCARRGIKLEWIRSALEHAERTLEDDQDPDLIHAFWPVPEKGFRVLRVVYNETVEPVAVVTAFFDSKVKLT